VQARITESIIILRLQAVTVDANRRLAKR